MHEGGCTAAVVRPSVHPNHGFGGGISNDLFYRYNQHHQQQLRQQDQDAQQLQCLDYQMLRHKIAPRPSLVPSSTLTSTIHQAVRVEDIVEKAAMKQKLTCGDSVQAITTGGGPHEILECRGDAELLGERTPRILDHRSGDTCRQTGELGCMVRGAKRRLSWVNREEVQHRRFQRSSRNGLAGTSYPFSTLPILERILSLPSSPLTCPAMPLSPECKIPEPSSLLDLATSPLPILHSATTPSYDFAAISLGDEVLLVDDLFSHGNVETIPAGAPPVGTLKDRGDVERIGMVTPSILDRRKVDASNETGELGCAPRRRLSWVQEGADHRGCKIAEPRSALDLAMSPPPIARSATTPSFGFAGSSLRDGVLLDDDLFSDFHRQDSSSAAAQLLGLGDDEDKSRGTSSTIDWVQQTSQLWDSLIDDLTDNNPVDSSSLPRIDEGDECRDEARIDTQSPSTSELCHASPNFNHEQSDDRGGEEKTIERRTPDSAKVQKGETPEDPNLESEHELLNALLACAEAVSTKSVSLINPHFAQLGELASPGGTTMQRLAAYFTEGLAIRCTRLWPHIYQPLPDSLDVSEEENLSAFHILNQVCPYVKFAHFTANDIILRAFEGCDRVHVIDLDIQQGLQWPALFQSLAARPGGPPTHVRVTGVGENKEDLFDTGDRLADFAEALDLSFEFHPVIDRLEDVRLWMLHVKELEPVAVNCVLQLHQALRDKENGIKDMLGVIASTKPKVVAVVEQEASHNSHSFEGRFLEALQHYGAIFDSLDATMPQKSKNRLKVERFFAQEIRNIVACEGSERTERHELISTWRLHMHRGGFKSVGVSKRARTQARLLLDLFACKSYTISDEEDDDALTLGWQSRSLFTASAWTLKL